MEDVIPSDVRSSNFSLRTGYYLACASNFAYEELGPWIEKLGLSDDTSVFTCGPFHGFVGFLDTIGVVAFRGTQSIGNCLTDAETPLVLRPPYPGRVHLGFAQAVDRVWPEILRLLGEPTQSKPVWVTGHSLGGAMATLASVRLESAGYKVRAVYTYGSPRVGDRTFHRSYALPNYRFVHHNDLVPHMPFRWCYKHVGHLRLLHHEGDILQEAHAWIERKRSLRGKAKHVQRSHRRAIPDLHEFTDFDWLADHSLEGYLAAIRRLLLRVADRSCPPVLTEALVGPPRHSRRIDPPAPSLPPPHEKPISRQKAAISERELAEAFFRQSQRWGEKQR